MGARTETAPGDWPDATSAAQPVVYVSPGTGAGTGTRESPYHNLAEALAATPTPATVLLARGTYALERTVTVSSPVTIRGMGATATIFTVSVGMSALQVGTSTSSDLAVTLASLGVRGDNAPNCGASDDIPSGVRVVGAGTTLTIQDVIVEEACDGVRVEGATLCGRGLTVHGSRHVGLALKPGSASVLRDFMIYGGHNVGVLADNAVVAMRSGLVADHARDGFAVRGVLSSSDTCTPSSGDAGPPAGNCPTLTRCGDVMVEQQCVANKQVFDRPATGIRAIAPTFRCRAVSTLEDVAIVGNHITGLRAERLPPPSDAGPQERARILAEPGPLLRGVRLVVGNTGTLPGEVGGDGVYVGPSASLTLDRHIQHEDAGTPGSLVTGNARTGALIDGDRSSATADGGILNELQATGSIRMYGTVVRSNQGPGLYVQERAVAEEIAFGTFNSNGALGLGVTSGGRTPLIRCEHFVGTRMGTIVTETLGPITLADGLSMSQGTGTMQDTRIEGNVFTGNGRYGFVLSGFSATFAGINRARGNTQGVAYFGDRVSIENPGTLEGLTRLSAPPRVASGAQSGPATR